MALESTMELINIADTITKTNLYRLRCNKGASEQYMAKFLEVHEKTYKKYEKKPETLSGEQLIKLSKFFKVNIEYLLDNTEIGEPIDKILDKTYDVLKDYKIDDITIDAIYDKIESKITLDISNSALIDKKRELSLQWKKTINKHLEQAHLSTKELIAKKIFSDKVKEDDINAFLFTAQAEHEVRMDILLPILKELSLPLEIIEQVYEKNKVNDYRVKTKQIEKAQQIFEDMGKHTSNELTFRRISLKSNKLSADNRIVFLAFLKYLKKVNTDKYLPRQQIVGETLSDRVRYLRNSEGIKMTQEELSEEINCAKRTLCSIENTFNPETIKMKHIVSIASFFKVSIDELVDNTTDIAFDRFYRKYLKLLDNQKIAIENYLKNEVL